ncbi:hypothetical protein INR49_013349 [Caranx melampygus]|nr:hypothetical protein INR49_013349 [Caranx melampygus]
MRFLLNATNGHLAFGLQVEADRVYQHDSASPLFEDMQRRSSVTLNVSICGATRRTRRAALPAEVLWGQEGVTAHTGRYTGYKHTGGWKQRAA